MGVIKNLFHVSLQANDYSASLNFYCKKLGFEQMFELNVGQFKDMLHMGIHDENDNMPWLTYLRVAPDQYIEMFNGAINPPDFVKKAIPHYNDSPLNWFALGTEDKAAAIERLEKMDIHVQDDFFTDPDGIKIKIVKSPSVIRPIKERLFTSLTGLSLFVNDVPQMADYFEKMTFKKEKMDKTYALLSVAGNQFLELKKGCTEIHTHGDDVLGHFALGIFDVKETVKAWDANGLHCCYQPFMPDNHVPANDSAKGNIGLDRCEIIWVICPEGNKVEVMVEPGNTMQQEWERKHSY